MEYEVVFEVTEISRIHYYAGAGVFLGLFLAAFSIFLGTFGTAAHTRPWEPALAMLFSVAFLCASVYSFIGATRMTQEIYGNYAQGNVQIAEGMVENCDTAHFYKNGRGSFEIDGVVFNYGHTTGIPGYRGKGNLIHEDGQRARIHYVAYGGENVILKLELEKT